MSSSHDTRDWLRTLEQLELRYRVKCIIISYIFVFAEDKFAVGSGARLISVCYFEKDNDW